MAVVLALAAATRRVTARIHRPLFWRLLYGLVESPVTVAATAWMLRIAARLRGRSWADRLLAELGAIFVWSGWPHHERGWINLHASRFLARVRRRLSQSPPVVPRRRPSAVAAPLRVGCAAAFAGLLTLSREHLAAAAPGIEVVVFDVGFDGRFASSLADVVASYRTFESGPDRSHVLAAAITDAALDVLLVVAPVRDVYDALDRIDTPCIVNLCSGSDLLHHPRVDVQLYPQPEADYFPVDGRLFCGTSRSPFGDGLVVPGFFVYDARGLDTAQRRTWAEREPLVVVHGSLHKTASQPFLNVLFELLRADDSVELAIVGRDSDGALAAILDGARRAGVAERVAYEGGFTFVRGNDGTPTDPTWERVRDLLGRARLAPDPWPLGAGASRLEGYAAGVPSVHLSVRFDLASWGRPQHSIAEIEALRVPRGSAASPEEYLELCGRCLVDEAFADLLAADQLAVCGNVTDARAFWEQLRDAHEQWLKTGLR